MLPPELHRDFPANTARVLASWLQGTGYVKLSPRRYSSIGLFAFFDGNLIGGALLGVGMAMSGSCPGTVLSQVGTGVKSGYFTLAGTIFGGIVWTGFLKSFLAQKKEQRPEREFTIYGSLSLSKKTVVPAMVVIIVTVVGSMAALTASSPKMTIPTVVGGLFVGTAQFFSLLSRKSLVGI